MLERMKIQSTAFKFGEVLSFGQQRAGCVRVNQIVRINAFQRRDIARLQRLVSFFLQLHYFVSSIVRRRSAPRGSPCECEKGKNRQNYRSHSSSRHLIISPISQIVSDFIEEILLNRDSTRSP
jgi:hypothetical protein